MFGKRIVIWKALDWVLTHWWWSIEIKTCQLDCKHKLFETCIAFPKCSNQLLLWVLCLAPWSNWRLIISTKCWFVDTSDYSIAAWHLITTPSDLQAYSNFLQAYFDFQQKRQMTSLLFVKTQLGDSATFLKHEMKILMEVTMLAYQNCLIDCIHWVVQFLHNGK